MMLFLVKNWKLCLYGAAGVALFSTIVTFMVEYNNTRQEVKILRENAVKLEYGIMQQQQVIQDQQDAIVEWDNAFNEMQQRIEESRRIAREANEESKRLRGIFSKHDLRALALAKPGLIENRINSGSSSSNRMLECASGTQSSCAADADTDAE